jgi:hypothetical protein
MPRKPRKVIKGVDVIYRRHQTGALMVRDKFGHRAAVILKNGEVGTIQFYGGMPWYGRVVFNLERQQRFAGGARSQDVLAQAFANGTKVGAVLWYPLPAQRKKSRRTPNQGMAAAMNLLGCPGNGATAYANWLGYTDGAYEWCHLIAHAMGGQDSPLNVVAGRNYNNTEQLAIENALSQYRAEDLFELSVQAAVLNNGNGKHFGNVIRYSLRNKHGGSSTAVYLDCRPTRQPSAIHQYTLIGTLSRWMNQQIKQYCNDFKPSATDQKKVKKYLKDNDYLDEDEY